MTANRRGISLMGAMLGCDEGVDEEVTVTQLCEYAKCC